MPIGPYKNWDECIADQKKNGKSDESAKKICGKLEQEAKARREYFEDLFNIERER